LVSSSPFLTEHPCTARRRLTHRACAPQALSLCARARQFSSFMLLVGKLGSADTFEPAHAIILQNKDELKIPLMLEQLPTAAEFRDAIESLSPEQQHFCQVPMLIGWRV
jgi:hypothetical protein